MWFLVVFIFKLVNRSVNGRVSILANLIISIKLLFYSDLILFNMSWSSFIQFQTDKHTLIKINMNLRTIDSCTPNNTPKNSFDKSVRPTNSVGIPRKDLNWFVNDFGWIWGLTHLFHANMPAISTHQYVSCVRSFYEIQVERFRGNDNGHWNFMVLLYWNERYQHSVGAVLSPIAYCYHLYVALSNCAL